MFQTDSPVAVSTTEKRRLRVPRQPLFMVILLALLCLNFAIARAGMVLRNPPVPGEVTSAEMRQAFITGLRFDLATSAYILLPITIIFSLPWLGLERSRITRRVFLVIATIILATICMLSLSEYEFFHEFRTRYNQLVIVYLDQKATVASMVWNSFPVIRYTLFGLLWTAVLVAVLWLVMKLTFSRPESREPIGWGQRGLEVVGIAGLVVGLLVCIRGGFQSEPIRWGDAVKTQSAYANELGLNGIYTLGRTLFDSAKRSDNSRKWTRAVTPAEAKSVAHELVFAPGETPVNPAYSEVLRVLQPGDSWLKLKDGVKPNVVVILMESFSARFSGSVGAAKSMTPEFDKIAREGVLFRRAFSAGSHTHQGIFASLLGFPNLPGYEVLMQDSISKQPFSSVPGVLKQNGYRTLMLYNGDFAWDNMYGMFRDQGVERFIGRQEFSAEKQTNATWGVADDAVFQRANEEFEAMAKQGPFCGLIVTLSNHVPFILPNPLPFPKTTDMGESNDRMDAMRFADWAMGQFINEAKTKSYFKNTLFVFVGDHGFHVSPKMTDVHLLFHHVPLLFYGPEILTPATAVRDEAACQVNIAPSLFGLLGIKTPVALWSRSLFSNAYADPNWAIFKNSSGSTAVAMAREDKLLCVDTAGKPTLYRYDLSFPPTLDKIDNEPELKKKMEHQLRAYIQGAMIDLQTFDGSHQADVRGQ